MGDSLPCTGIRKIRLGLCKAQAELGILDDKQRVALVHGLIFLETYPADKTLHPRVDGSDMPAHPGIVGIFHAPEMQEA